MKDMERQKLSRRQKCGYGTRMALAAVLWVAMMSGFAGNKVLALDSMGSGSVTPFAMTDARSASENDTPLYKASDRTRAYLDRKISVSLEAVSLEQALQVIASRAGLKLSYKQEPLLMEKEVTLDVQDESVFDVLLKTTQGTPLRFKVLPNGQLIVALEEAGTPPVMPAHAVSGVVTSLEDGEPLPGVNVVVKGTTVGTATDYDGRYSLEAPGVNDTLIFSFVGFLAQEVPIQGRSVIDVALASDVQNLSEVVVVAFGTQEKASITSAVTAVTGEDLAERPGRNIQSALQGKAPGLTVWDQGGEPGAANIFFRIRGTTTIGNNDPLVIVDGIEQAWSNINPNEIETITVLKDAASTAIYGSRGANGIILITTRRGASGKMKVSYNSSVDFQNLATVPEHMDTESYLRLQNLAYKNRGSEEPYSEEDIQKYVSGEDRLKYPAPNTWFDTVINKNAPMQNHSLTISGGAGQLSTLVALSYFDQEGVYPNRDAQHYQVRLNNDLKLSEKLNIGADIHVRRSERSTVNYSGNLYHWMIHGSQWAVPVYPDGTYGLSPQGRNPLAFSDPELFGRTRSKTDYSVLNLKATWEIVKGLEFMSQYGIELNKWSSISNVPTYEIRDYWNKDVVLQRNNVNSLSEGRSESLKNTWNNVLTYKANLQRHDVTLMGGYSEIAYDYNNLSASGREFYNNEIRALGQSDPENRDLGGGYSDWGLRSFFGRFNYAFADRYLLEFNMRYDGSSRFPKGDRYSFFPSVSLGWRIAEEPFWEPLKLAVPRLKPRFSWGKAGNQNVGLYTFFDRLAIGNYYVFNNTPVTGVRQNALTSQGLTWETTTQTNIGLDASFFNSQLDLTFDWFNKLTDGILLSLPVPGILGLTPAPANAGSVRNTGWELQLEHRNYKGALKYGVTVNLSDVKNEVIDLAGTGPYFAGEKDWNVTMEGQPIDALWGYVTDGFYTQADFDNGYPTLAADAVVGDIKYVDLNGDGKISSDDRTILGSTFPRWTYGASLDLMWKALDFKMHVQGVAEQDMAVWGAFVENGSWEGFTLAVGKDYWTPENPDARFPRPQKTTQKNTHPSDMWVENAAYMRLKNLQLGYTLPVSVTDKAGIGRLRVYVGGTNLLTLSGLKKWGTDAETRAGRTDYYQPVKTYTVGVNLEL